jgi:hypothetical protein
MLLTVSPTVVHALTAQYAFDRDTYYQGESGTVTIELYNDNPLFQWHINEVGIQFDWQIPQKTWFATTVNTNIASGQSYSLTQNFAIDTGVAVGGHSFEIQYIGLFNDQHTIASGSLYIHDVYEKLAREAMPTAQSKLQSAQSTVSDADSEIGNAHFTCSAAQNNLGQAQQTLAQAKTDLGQAQDNWNAANSAFNSGSFQEAYNDYKQSAASADAATNAAAAAKQQLQNARDAENCGSPIGPGSNSSFGWLFGLVIGVIVAALIGGVAVRASRKGPQTQLPPTPMTLGTEFVHCIYCGSKIAPSASFCEKCGRAQQ